jgi:hypothetical protein
MTGLGTSAGARAGAIWLVPLSFLLHPVEYWAPTKGNRESAVAAKVKETEKRAPETGQYDCVEIYLPKRLKHLSELYRFLRERLTVRPTDFALKGFSIYEVDGAFSGETIWEERTLVIRIFFPRPANYPQLTVQATVNELGREIVQTIAHDEEEVWICYYEQIVTAFRPVRKSR